MNIFLQAHFSKFGPLAIIACYPSAWAINILLKVIPVLNLCWIIFWFSVTFSIYGKVMNDGEENQGGNDPKCSYALYIFSVVMVCIEFVFEFILGIMFLIWTKCLWRNYLSNDTP